MENPFINFSEEEYEKYSELFSYNTELEDGKIIVWGGEDTSLTLVKHFNGDIFMEVEEEEGVFIQNGDSIYLTSEVWWSKLNELDQLVEDVKNGEELYWSEYE